MGTTVKKISVSIDEDAFNWARSQAKATKTSVSAVLTEALQEQRRLAAMDRLLKRLGADKISEKTMAELETELRALEASK